jgi:hypothetical protein
MSVAEVTRKHVIAWTTYFAWKAKYGNATGCDLTRLREFEQENARLNWMYAGSRSRTHLPRTS